MARNGQREGGAGGGIQIHSSHFCIYVEESDREEDSQSK